MEYVKFLRILKLGKPHGLVCSIRSEGGDGGVYEPPEMQWILDGGFPKDNENTYEMVNIKLDFYIYYITFYNICKKNSYF